MKLPDVRDFDLKGKTVLLRTDYDVPLLRQSADQGKLKVAERKNSPGEFNVPATLNFPEEDLYVADDTRIRDSIETINLLLAKGAKIIILAHLGRPEGEFAPDLSLEPVAKILSQLLKKKVPLVQLKDFSKHKGKESMVLENLRFDPREEEKDEKQRQTFAKELAELGDFYVNNAFASCHRKHASIVDLPRLLPHAAGLDLLEEIKILSSVTEKPKRPVVIILGGVKKDKLDSVNGLLGWVDLVLIGGKLAEYPEVKRLENHRRIMAVLTKTGEDITIESAEKFVERVRSAGTIIWSGPLGKIEEPRFERGTKIFAEAMAESKAFTIVGGGDTEAVLTRFGVVDKIDYVSSGGGAMLAFLAKGDLPGLKALSGKS